MVITGKPCQRINSQIKILLEKDISSFSLNQSAVSSPLQSRFVDTK